MANEAKELYQYEDVFRLVFGGVNHNIEEPVGWDKIMITGDRDKDYYGFNYEFVDDKITLLFENILGGGNMLRGLYDQYGSDADCNFEYGYIKQGNFFSQLVATVNFNDKSDNADGYTISLQKTYFESLIRTRYETKVSMTDTKSLDGLTIVPPAPLKIKLHSKKIIKRGRGENAEPNAETPVLSAGSNTSYIQPDTTNVTIAEVETLFGLPLGITVASPMSEDRFHFKAVETGTTKIKWNCSYSLIVYGGDTSIGNYSLLPAIRIYRGGAMIREITDPAMNVTGSAGSIAVINHSLNFEAVQDLIVDDIIFFYSKFTCNNTVLANRQRVVRGYNGYIEITEETIAPASFCEGYKILDSANHIVNAITGKNNRVLSSFFGAGGCGEKYLLASGFQVRGFTAADKPAKISFKDILTGAHPIWNAALQYATKVVGDVVMLEPVDAFFGLNRIFTFRAVDMDYNSYKEDHSKAFTFNEVEIGYTKFPEDDANTLDEYNTYQNWLLPIKTYKTKYTKRSTWIASGYYLESVRRDQFKVNPSASLSTDDDIFVIAYITQRQHKSVNFSFLPASNTVVLSKSINLVPGDQFSLAKDGGGPNDATVFTVLVRNSSYAEAYRLTAAPLADSGIGTVSIVIVQPEAEKNEAFDVADNIYSAETAYNLRITPAQMLLNHSEILNSCMEKKPATDTLQNTLTKNNGKLITKYNPAAPCLPNDLNNTLQQDAPIVLADYNSRRQYFMPREVSFKVEMNYDDLIYLKERITGQTGTTDDFGLVAFPDINNVFWEGYVWGFNYDPNECIADFLIMKKRKL